MVELLKEHRNLLTDMLSTIPHIDNQPYSTRVLMGVYTEILKDGISILSSLINYYDT